MTYVTKRASGYAGYYRDPEGKRRSAGIHPTRKEAKIAADRAEAGLTPEGTPRDDLTLERHYERWTKRPDPEILPNTIRGYEHAFRTHILPLMGDRLVSRINRTDVEEMLAEIRAQGHSEHQVAITKAALGACLRVLVPHVLTYNPTHGIKIRKPAQEDYPLLSREELMRILAGMPTRGAKLFAFFLSATGCRHGEAAEIRVKDVKIRTEEISVTRRVTDLIRKDSHGRRFMVIPGTKAGINKGRTIGASPQLLKALGAWISDQELGTDDLVFPDHLVNPEHRSIRPLRTVKPGSQFYDGNRTYRHGTAYGYTGGGCRCEDCREALRAYRSSRREASLQEVEHLSTNTWGKIWRRAVDQADLNWKPRSYDLRHYYATMLVADGVALPEVARLMGHSSIETTMRYQRRVDAQTSKARSVVSAATPDEFL